MADKEDKANGSGYVIVPRFPATDPQKVFHYTDLQRSKPTRANDPYEYLQGWGNRHQSEVIPGTLPAGQNNPQENRFGLYTEGITYSAFAAPRHANFSTYMYRVRPAAAHSTPPFLPHNAPLFLHPLFHTKTNKPMKTTRFASPHLNSNPGTQLLLTENNAGGYTPLPSPNIENCFLSINPKVALLPQQAEWTPFPIPPASQPTDFVTGLHTLAGSGDPNIREGIALYVYTLNTSMTPRHKSYCNNDGDFLLCAQQGNLDIRTEFGKLFLQPGEIFVVQRGVRFSVDLAEGEKEARGYVTEVWGSMWELPDLGPIGGHGLANPRDFLFPVAAIDEELQVDWKIVVCAFASLLGCVE